MALLSKCVRCNTLVSHRANETPECDRCSGREDRRRAKLLRWNGLTLEERVNELLTRVEALENRSNSDGLVG